MTVSAEGDLIRLHGPVAVEDAEALFSASLAGPGRPVDWSEAGPLHTAVIQALLTLCPRLIGSPTDAFDRKFVEPLLRRRPVP